MKQQSALFPLLDHALVDYFVPPDLRGSGTLAEQKARLVPLCALALGLWGPIFAPIFFFTGAPVAALLLLVGTVINFLTPFVMRWSGSLVVAGNYLAGQCYVTLVTMLVLSGGLNAETSAWCILVPIFATIFAGLRSAVVWIALTVASFATLFAVGQMGVALPTVIPRDNEFVTFVGPSALIVVVWSLFVLNSHIQSWLTRSVLEREAELEEARDRALEANRAKSAFLANMSHELRTPLNAVIGYSEMLTEEIDFIAQREEGDHEVVRGFVPDLERIRSAGKHLLAIVNDVLDLSKVEAGKMNVHLEHFDVAELIDDVVMTVRPMAKKNDDDLLFEVGDNVGDMYSDPMKVRQILFNLLNNACKFTRAGQVRLSVEALDHARGVGRDYLFTVEDNGIGMSAEQLDRIFQAFTQADESTTREFGGTGLGLTITHQFCELLGGDIAVESTEGEGSTFRVTLPADVKRLESEGDGAAPAY